MSVGMVTMTSGAASLVLAWPKNRTLVGVSEFNGAGFEDFVRSAAAQECEAHADVVDRIAFDEAHGDVDESVRVDRSPGGLPVADLGAVQIVDVLAVGLVEMEVFDGG
jgi:hypothetical protein